MPYVIFCNWRFFPIVLLSLSFSCQNFVSCYFLFYFHPTFFFLKQQMPCWIDNNNTMLWPCSLCFYLSILISLCFHPTFLNNITMLVLPALVFLFLSPTFNGKSQNWPCLSCFLFYFILFQSFTLRSPGAALSRICLERASNVLIAICNIFATGGFFFQLFYTL